MEHIFARQVPIGPFVADFACMAARLVIEVDGSQHGEDKNVLHDQARTRWLEAVGYRVIRFWNNDLVTNMDGVLESIYVAVHGASNAEPTPIKHKRRQRIVSDAASSAMKRADPPRQGEDHGK
jgi:very-short-patch-repair endonuclease